MNPITKAIERMFSNELSGSNWKKFNCEDIIYLYDKYSKEEISFCCKDKKFGPPLSIIHDKIVKKLAKSKTVEEQISYLSERMM